MLRIPLFIGNECGGNSTSPGGPERIPGRADRVAVRDRSSQGRVQKALAGKLPVAPAQSVTNPLRVLG